MAASVLASSANVKRIQIKRVENNRPLPCPLKIQANRLQGQQPRLQVSFPLALAAASDLNAADQMQRELLERSQLHRVRLETPPPTDKRRARKN